MGYEIPIGPWNHIVALISVTERSLLNRVMSMAFSTHVSSSVDLATSWCAVRQW